MHPSTVRSFKIGGHRASILDPRHSLLLAMSLRRRLLLIPRAMLLRSTRTIASHQPRGVLMTTSSGNTAARRLALTANWIRPQNKQMSTLNATGETQAEVLGHKNLAVREIILNRQKKLNALNLSMIRSILPLLQSWEKSDLAKTVILKSSGGKGFCAGGDVKTVIDLAEAKDPQATKFFEEEYQLDHLISVLKKPFISIMDGITMGGGVGLSVHAPFRIATENTLFAMPETAIGFLPEVGGSFFLPRLDGQLGTYLGLTGKRLKGVDVLYAGVATHYVPSSRLESLEARLAELDDPTHDTINTAIEDFSAEMDQEPGFSLGGDIRAAIDRCFKFDTVEEIVAALEKEDSEWAADALKLLSKMSPTSLKVTLMQLRSGATLSISQCFKMEYHLVQKFLEGHDFKEGVTATLVTKSNPNWQPASLNDVDLKKIKKEYFDSPSPMRLELLSRNDFRQYPHRKYMLPSEEDIKQVVTGEAAGVGNYALSKDEVVDYIVRDRNQKQGVKTKVLEVLERKTSVSDSDQSKSLKWSY